MDDDERYAISELAEEAAVSVRTVRYYIAEGLLPPAVTAGARSYYTRDHLDRLRLIGRMKEGYLPLREIRKHLMDLDGETVRQLAAPEIIQSPQPRAPAMPVTDTLAPTRPRADSLHDAAFMLGEDDIRPSRADPSLRESATEYIARALGTSAKRRTERSSNPGAPEPFPEIAGSNMTAASLPRAETSLAWRRIAIGDGAELLVRDDVYHRRRDKIEWLADWARKVLD